MKQPRKYEYWKESVKTEFIYTTIEGKTKISIVVKTSSFGTIYSKTMPLEEYYSNGNEIRQFEEWLVANEPSENKRKKVFRIKSLFYSMLNKLNRLRNRFFNRI